MKSEQFLGDLAAKGIYALYKKIEKNELRWPFPLIDPNKINVDKIADYLGSEEFLGTNIYFWKEMRKLDNDK